MKNYKKQIALFLYVSLFIITGSFAILFVNFRKQVKLQNEIMKLQTTLIQVNSLTNNLLQVESDKRGFQLTRDRDYLTNYDSIKSHYDVIIAELGMNITADADRKTLAQIDSLLFLRIRDLDKGIAVFISNGVDSAINFMQLEDHTVTRIMLGQKVDTLKNNLLQKLNKNAAVISKRSNQNLAGVIILLGIGVMVMFFAHRMFRRAQQKIINKHIKFKEAQRIGKIGSWDWDIATDQLKWSQEQFRLFGEDRKTFSLTHKGYLSHLSPTEQDRTNALIKNALEGKGDYAVEHEIIQKNGKALMVFEQGTVLFDENNKPTGMFGTTQDITDRKMVEEKLVLAQKRIQEIFDNTADGIYQSTPDGKFIMTNQAMAGIFGYSSAEELALAVTDIGAQLYADKGDRKRMSEILSTRDHLENFEVPLLTKSKEIVWVNESTRIVRDENGEISYYEGTLKDITERKKAELALHTSEQRYRQIVETAQEGIWVLDENNYTVLVNKKMCEMLEYSREEMMGKQNYYFKDEEGKKKAMQDIERRKNGVTETQISKFLSKSGKVVWTSVSTNPIFDETGKYAGALGMFTDITEQKKADEELIAAKNKFQAIFDNTADGIYQSTTDGKFIMANPSMARIFGYDSPDDLIRSVNDIATQIYADPGEREKMSAQLMQEGHINDFELQVLTKNKEVIWVCASIRIVRDENGEISYFEGTLENITERLKAREEILQLNSSLDQFANITAHDLQEPIRMVSGFLGLLHKRYKDTLDEQGQSYIHRAKDGADRMSILIRDLLEFSRSGNKMAKKELVDLGVVMDLVDRDMSIAMADTGTILRIPAFLPVMTGNQSALYRLFLNLVSNGIKFRKKDTIPEISLTIKEAEDFWEFTLADNGIGIAEKDQPKLFQAFQRLHRRDEYPGTGLGLVTCRKIVEAHGGRIWMTSAEGQGTSFHFTINKTQ